ncbi:NAD(P)/FAD-dependent oxidoreductase [Fundicoccus culcitae]|uniref:FAD-binding oxidoreductase n=1 Tax=Fundicoccus culcitae TaxID=2969821 RepID=A0ABY5P3H2_9LACT|nr:FAD-binding oxidoreductase [Fundicoccus culcitae]UUX33160.1 FAD-binding oxidoreductase [Fundicoccus culcitae]
MEVAIIGGGIVGSTAAYYLSRAGYAVTLFDEGGGQATKAAAGIICPWFTQRRNKPWYFLVSQGAEFYRQLMADLEADGFETDHLFQVTGALLLRNRAKKLERDLQMAQEKVVESPSIGEVLTVAPEDLQAYFPLLESEFGATYVAGGGRADGAAIIQSLHQAMSRFGGRIVKEKARLVRGDNQTVWVGSRRFEVKGFDKILLSNGAWLPEILEPLGYSVAIQPQKGQLFSVYNRAWEGNQWPVVMPDAAIDIIPTASGQLIIGASHEDDQGYDLTLDEGVLAELKEEAATFLPWIKASAIATTRVGTRAFTPDYGVLVGQVPELTNVWAISGLGSSGLTSGPFLGYEWSQLVMSGKWQINPNDFPINAYITPNNL